MASFKEIVTKTVIGKGKKQFSDNLSLQVTNRPTTILGCWVINHSFSGELSNNTVIIKGSYDINIWYSYDNDTKTAVSTKRYAYNDNINVNLKDNTGLSSSNEIIVRSLKQPTVSDVKIDNNLVKVVVEKELAVEVIGDTKIKVSIEELDDDYEIADDNDISDEVIDEIDENYLN